jgi:hypothetical protein
MFGHLCCEAGPAAQPLARIWEHHIIIQSTHIIRPQVTQMIEGSRHKQASSKGSVGVASEIRERVSCEKAERERGTKGDSEGKRGCRI